MVEQRALSALTTDEKAKLMNDVNNAFSSNDAAKNLGSLKMYDQLVTNLGGLDFNRETVLVVEANFKTDQSAVADKVKEQIKEALKGINNDNYQLDISCKVGVGDNVADIENATKVSDSSECTIKHNEGEVILYDLWATWCPPCQAPMAHNQEMLTKNKEKWEGKVRIIGLSIDNGVDVVKKHVDAKGWNAVEHYHVGNGKCKASETYGSGGVPHVFLTDKNGKIVFMGHPMERDLEGDINKLINGEVITGKGTGASAEEASSEGGAAKDPAEIEAALAKFATDAAEFVKKDEVKNCVKNEAGEPQLMRAFCVVVDTITLKGD